MNNKKSFILYVDSLEVINELTDKQIANLFRAIISHQKGSEYKLTQVERIAFLPIKNYMDRDSDKWEKTRSKRAKAGRVGGIKSGKMRKQKEAKEANASKSKQKEANEAVNVNVNVNVNDNVNDNTYKTFNSIKTNKPEVIKKLKGLYPDKDCEKMVDKFIEANEIKNYKYKNYWLALCKWTRSDNTGVGSSFDLYKKI